MPHLLCKLKEDLFPQESDHYMKVTLWILLAVSIAFPTYAQVKLPEPGKKIIDQAAYETWPVIQQQKISNDGRFVAYVVRTGTTGSKLTIQASDNSWKNEFGHGYNLSISGDSRFIIFQLPGDSLAILSTRDKKLAMIPGTSSYKIPLDGNSPWLAYQQKGNYGTLTLRNFATGKETSYQRVAEYCFDANGQVLFLQTAVEKANGVVFDLKWVDLIEARQQIIYRAKRLVTSFGLDGQGRQLAFIDEQGPTNTLMYYRAGTDSAVMRVDNTNPTMEAGMDVGTGEIQFSRNGKKLFFQLRKSQQKIDIKDEESSAQVDVWSYHDIYLQSQQMKDLENESARTYRAVINTGESKIIRLETDDDDWTTFEMADNGDAEFISIRSRYDFSQEHWNPSSRQSISLVSTVDGRRIPVARKIMSGYHGKLYSPDGKFLIWYDREKHNYFTYNIKSGKIKNITGGLPVAFYNEKEDHPMLPYPIGIAGWLEDDQAVLLYDQYDIWQLDPDGNRLAVNITNGYGRRTKTYLRYVPARQNWHRNIKIKTTENLLISGFNERTKDNGFFSKDLIKAGDPSELTMGPYLYYYCYNFLPSPALTMMPSFLLRAKDTAVYVLNRMTVTDYPDLYTTTDFKKLVALTNLQPQKEYNWINSELVHWKTFDGKGAEGILYKPEDFDPRKRYPVIFYFYEKDANALHNYLFPDYSDGQINIPTFVSNGYLVFDPNIYYKVGEPLESVYNSVASAARHLSKLPWVDSTKMGIQGHSFGGYEVNCLVSRTGMFAAAVSAAGFSDLVSMYGNLRNDFGITGLDWIEAGQTGIGATLWKKPQLFIRNSPIFMADKVTTPLLIMHNKGDGASPFSQSIEFFTALRRLNKKAWLLQYDASGHQVGGLFNRKDYSKRLLQFFDHYLKSSPAPKWLSRGIPASLKGVETGFELLDDAQQVPRP